MSDGGPIFLTIRERARRISVRIKWAACTTAVVLALFTAGCFIRVTVPVVWPVGATLAALAGAGCVLWLLVRGRPCPRCVALDAPHTARHAARGRTGQVSDADRDAAIEALTRAYVDGVHDLPEHERRVAACLTATTPMELSAARTGRET